MAILKGFPPSNTISGGTISGGTIVPKPYKVAHGKAKVIDVRDKSHQGLIRLEFGSLAIPTHRFDEDGNIYLPQCGDTVEWFTMSDNKKAIYYKPELCAYMAQH